MGETAWSAELSRRSLLQGTACAAGAAALLGTATNAAAADKVSQQSVEYQNTPKGEQRCDNCLLFEPPAGCKVVEGPIAAQGWCKTWAAKPK